MTFTRGFNKHTSELVNMSIKCLHVWSYLSHCCCTDVSAAARKRLWHCWPTRLPSLLDSWKNFRKEIRSLIKMCWYDCWGYKQEICNLLGRVHQFFPNETDSRCRQCLSGLVHSLVSSNEKAHSHRLMLMLRQDIVPYRASRSRVCRFLVITCWVLSSPSPP